MPAPIIAAAGKAVAAAAKQYAKRKAVEMAKRKAIGAAQKATGSGNGGTKLAVLLGVVLLIMIVMAPVMLIVAVLPSTSGGAQDAASRMQCGVGANAGQEGIHQDALGDSGPKPAGGSAASGTTVDSLSPAQIANVKKILGAGKAMGVNRHAGTITIMVSMVETNLLNYASDVPSEAESKSLPHDAVGRDHDSVGVMQQRAAWGKVADRMNPAIATKLFLEGGAGGQPGLFDVKGWEQLPLGVAAQKVQRSAFADRYGRYEAFGQQVYDKFIAEAEIPAGMAANPAANAAPGPAAGGQGQQCGPGALSGMNVCPSDPGLDKQMEGMQPDTRRVSTCAHQKWPRITSFGGVREDSMPYHPSGRAVDIMMTGAGFPGAMDPGAQALGDEVSKFFQENASAFGVDHIIWKQHIWSPQRAGEGWRPMEDRGGVTANHFDHVHVTTIGNAAVDQTPVIPGRTGKGVYPVDDFRLGPKWHAVGNWAKWHTGVDLQAPIGTPVRAAADGKIMEPATFWQPGVNIIMAHPGGHSTMYWHLQRAVVNPGQQVKAGDIIGYVGVTGNTTGAHLHFEYYPPGAPAGKDLYATQDPLAWLKSMGAVHPGT